jgi:hypothetical protein
VNRDGVKDIIVASGAGIAGTVRVWDGATRSLLRDVSPFGAFGGGLTVATGDMNGDGAADLVIGARAGGWPVVSVISGATGKSLSQFLAYSTQFTGGLTIGVGDINHDGRADIAVGPASGVRRIRIFDGHSIGPGQTPVDLVTPFNPFSQQYQGGASLAVGDITGDGFADIVIGNASGVARFRLYSGAALTGGGTTAPLLKQDPWAYDGRGVRVSLVEDIDGDGRTELVLTKRGSNRALRLFSSQLTTTGWPAAAYQWFLPIPGTSSGIYVG